MPLRAERDKVKVAVVGLSGYGDSYLESLLTDPRRQAIELVGVADPAAHRCRRLEALRELRVPVHGSLEELLGETREIDLVMLATPTHLHSRHVCRSVGAGIDVLCEKPLSGSVAEAKRMLEAAEPGESSPEAPLVAIGYQWSFSAAIQRLKRDILAGDLGRPVRFRSIVSFPRGRGYYGRNDWAGRIRTSDGDPVLDSPVNNATSHYLHNMLYLLGDRRTTGAVPQTLEAELYRANPIETFDTAALRVITSDDVEVLFYTTHASSARVGPLTVLEFERGTVTHDALACGPLVARLADGSVRHYGDPNADRHEKIWQCVESVSTREAPACGVRAAMPHTLITAALDESFPEVTHFPGSLVTTQSIGDDTMVSVRDLDKTLLECLNAGCLPSEARVSWARAGRRVAVPNTEILAVASEGASRFACGLPVRSRVPAELHTPE